jgi:hypothetical protein
MSTLQAKSIATLLAELQPDHWRREAGFSAEVGAANSVLFKPALTESEAIQTIAEWLQKYQPCLFGRIGAKLGLLSYCILTEAELAAADEAIRDKIQEARTRWTRDGFEGRKSAFVILVISPTIAYASPDHRMEQLARRLCSLYLLEEVETDQIYLDEIFLEVPSRGRTTWRWHAGVNYFCAQGDKRWWQDHRIPGGMAFSVNSVGHMVKSGRLASAMNELRSILDTPPEDWEESKIDSLPKALEFAMRTIAIASEAVSGKATQLLPLPAHPGALPVQTCPVDLPGFLRDKNFCKYQGYYHTDYTLPSEYFVADVERPSWVAPHTLDFTYLFNKQIENLDFNTMGAGRRVRRLETVAQSVPGRVELGRGLKAWEDEVPVATSERLVKALGA